MGCNRDAGSGFPPSPWRPVLRAAGGQGAKRVPDRGPSAQCQAGGRAGETSHLPGAGPRPVVRQQTARVATKHELNRLVSRAGGRRSCYRPWASRPQPDPGVSFQALRSAPQGWGGGGRDPTPGGALPSKGICSSAPSLSPLPATLTLCSAWGHFHLLSAPTCALLPSFKSILAESPQ